MSSLSAYLRGFAVVRGFASAILFLVVFSASGRWGFAGGTPDPLAADFPAQVQPLVKQYCLGCHSTAKHKGSLDLERFESLAMVRRNVKPWQAVLEQLEAGQMPPEDKPQPTASERARLIGWVRGFLEDEARARAGDPGLVPMRRLSNAEYDCTIRDLTGVDLHPTREFPADGAAGEGFTNAAEALSDISPTLFNKYLLTAKEIAAHAVLLPDGFRFSPGKTRRDWTDESLAKLRQFYARYTADGRIPLEAYFRATLRHRDALLAGRETLDEVAAAEKIDPRYLHVLWDTLTDAQPASPLDKVGARWQAAAEADAAALAAMVSQVQSELWKVVPIGSYRDGATSRQSPVDPPSAIPNDSQAAQVRRGRDEFRRCFPLFICYPAVIPVDEVVCLKMYHREDEPLMRLFLNETQRHEIDRLWAEHQFISQQPLAENTYLPLFIGFVTQDQTKELVAYFQGLRGPFGKRAEEFQKELDDAAGAQLGALADFASRAYRRPLRAAEKDKLLSLYQALRNNGASHGDAFRDVLARVLVAPSFLFRMEQAPPGKEAEPINDWELAARLSYFLWSSKPDEELRRIAAAGTLHQPAILAKQTRRMLKDERTRALAIEFGTQWIHVRGFDEFNEKSERLFPTFDASLKSAMYEESVLFFQDLFQQNRPFADVLDADYTYLNETLAKHYDIPGVIGSKWRKVDGVKKFGRGGILALGSVQAKQAGASRTSPVLRGNWVVETLLGEKLPRPPPDVPKLPEEEGASAGLTTRQLVENHTRAPACAGCHQRIDPIGFAFERYDTIGRWRDTESTGIAIDCHAKLKDGTELDGIDGLRHYLLTTKRDTVVKLFCRRLLGYALGRAVALSDEPLVETLAATLKSEKGRLSDAVLKIVDSPQFQRIRGSTFAEEE